MCIPCFTKCIKLALPQGARLIKDALLIDREMKRKKPSTRRDSSPRPLCHEAFALLLCYNDFSSLVYLKMCRYLLFSAKPGVSIVKIPKCLLARNYAKPPNFSRWGPPTCSVVCHASRMDATPLCVSACACMWDRERESVCVCVWERECVRECSSSSKTDHFLLKDYLIVYVRGLWLRFYCFYFNFNQFIVTIFVCVRLLTSIQCNEASFLVNTDLFYKFLNLQDCYELIFQYFMKN